MMTSLFLILLLAPLGHAGVLQDAFLAKDFEQVTKLYQDDVSKVTDEKELVMVSYSLRKQKRYREDIKLVYGMVKKFYGKDHSKILSSMKEGETLDGDEVPESLKIHYWNLFNDYAYVLKEHGQKSEALSKDHKHFLAFAKILGEVEFREAKVDRTVDSITAHLQYLDDKIYKFTANFSLQYVSWQQSPVLKGPAGETTLILTNRGYCTGGDMGVENHRFHLYVDGCFLYGSGGVKNDGGVDYQQSNLPGYGLKAGPGASVIVSSSRSRLGIRLPIIYSVQQLTTPSTAGYSIDKESQLSFLTTIYSRWQFDKWFFQTEFGKYVRKQESFWGLGFGRSF